MVFDTTIFTDVARAESVDGAAGFGFQAVSVGIDGADRSVITETLQHGISHRWPSGDDELEHPPTAAYHHKHGRHYLSRGISTGRTVSGRRGNQLTQTIVTRDASDILPYRPAQLYAAGSWALRHAASRECEQWYAPLEIAPEFEAQSLLEWVCEDPWMLKVLPAYLSMLEQVADESSRIVVLVHDDLDVVMRWFALGTLLLDEEAALSLDYRAFAAEPFRAGGARLVGAHPALMNLHGTSLAGTHSIDLVARTVSDIDITESAAAVCQWVRRLESFEALEVISIARRWMPLIGVRGGCLGAEMVTGTRETHPGREEWDLGIAVIEELAKRGQRDDLELYLDELADSVASYRLTGAEDFSRAARAARFAAGTGIPGLAQAILDPALESLSREPQHAGVWARELNADRAWNWQQQGDPKRNADLLTSVALGAPDDALDELLLLAAPLTQALSSEQLEPAVDRALRAALLDPRRVRREFNRWYSAGALRTRLRRMALERLADAQHTDTVCDQFSQGLWDFLEPGRNEVSQGALHFYSWILAGRLARVGIDDRGTSLRNQQERPGPDTWQLALRGLQLPDDVSLLRTWCSEVGMSASLIDHLLEELEFVLRQVPRTARAKDLEPWLALVELLEEAAPQDPRGRQAHVELRDILNDIPTMRDRVTSAADSVRSLFGKDRRDV
ncbi:MAG: hypothetical protein ACTHVY_09170 [Brevibacterium yomogidense]|uniref:GAP1-N2 domain-containing protein n=1 Tax=Brevibacterium sp. Mu109 TaxID=1255669 RepID=UPI000C4EBAD6|nr:hypothetical protein [Brevibacterium sp. Mu109]SMX89704.1 hypothetical protein BSP109_02405 [Brevibacterium sp. Mu109]